MTEADAWSELGGGNVARSGEPDTSEPVAAIPATGSLRCRHCGVGIEESPATGALVGTPHRWRHTGTLFRRCMPASLGLWAEPE